MSGKNPVGNVLLPQVQMGQGPDKIRIDKFRILKNDTMYAKTKVIIYDSENSTSVPEKESLSVRLFADRHRF